MCLKIVYISFSIAIPSEQQPFLFSGAEFQQDTLDICFNSDHMYFSTRYVLLPNKNHSPPPLLYQAYFHLPQQYQYYP